MHKILKECGLGAKFKISPLTSNLKLADFIGKNVRYKKELFTEEFIRVYGTIVKETIFKIEETQLIFDGREFLRGYECEYSFGRPIDPDHVEIV